MWSVLKSVLNSRYHTNSNQSSLKMFTFIGFAAVLILGDSISNDSSGLVFASLVPINNKTWRRSHPCKWTHSWGRVSGTYRADDGLCGHVRVPMATVVSQWNSTPEVEPLPSTWFAREGSSNGLQFGILGHIFIPHLGVKVDLKHMTEGTNHSGRRSDCQSRNNKNWIFAGFSKQRHHLGSLCVTCML